MTPVVSPFIKASRPDDASGKKPSENQNKQQAINDNKPQQDSAISPKCPFGYDSQTFKLGPLSCVICQALLFECSKCVPCSHVYCKACISRFKDCPLCGADIEKIEDDVNLQSVVDRFIEGHARIKRSQVDADKEEREDDKKTVIYEDVSLERGAFLMQQAMRALRANNIESAKSRFSICAEDVREQLVKMGNTPELCSQLGAVLACLVTAGAIKLLESLTVSAEEAGLETAPFSAGVRQQSTRKEIAEFYQLFLQCMKHMNQGGHVWFSAPDLGVL
ncbi:UNVERIFIED_CONTAM: protein NCA1 [Sesamum radiatum]|uniref:Protein NCA1 n=1 Tax=Sesamum radiatum TaxID=300843 RepID=A0AAW2JBL3_SESRA